MMNNNQYTFPSDISIFMQFRSYSRKEKVQLVKEHMQCFVRAVYADILREHGFISYGGEDLSWYRVSNNEVMHAIYFYTTRLDLPIFMEIGYGMHPLYMEAPLPVKPYVSMLPVLCSDVAQEGRLGFPNGVYASDTLVNCNYDNYGRSHLYDILNLFEQAKDLKSCYQTHRNFYEENELLNNISLTVITEAIYFNDTDFYPLCLARINRLVPGLQVAKFKICRQQAVMYQECKDAILEDRDAYLRLLSQRREVFIKKLVKAGIITQADAGDMMVAP